LIEADNETDVMIIVNSAESGLVVEIEYLASECFYSSISFISFSIIKTEASGRFLNYHKYLKPSCECIYPGFLLDADRSISNVEVLYIYKRKHECNGVEIRKKDGYEYMHALLLCKDWTATTLVNFELFLTSSQIKKIINYTFAKHQNLE
jgi:hypothetical protein